VRTRAIAILAALLLAAVAVFAADAKVETIGALTDTAVPDGVRQALAPQGYRVTLDDGSVRELWLRASVPVQKKDVAGALYPQLAESTMVGVLHFTTKGNDYRGQAIAPGYYALRYELIPSDGNHLGVSPNPDFVLLAPVAADPDPKAQFDFKALVELSRKATGTKHPGPMSLAPADKTVPGVSKDDQDHSIVSVKLKLESGDELPIGLVVKGTAQE